MSTGKILGLIFGIITGLISIALIVDGGLALWVDSKIDGNGYINSNTIEIDETSHAVVIEPLDIDEAVVQVLNTIGVAINWRVQGSSNDSAKGIFIGVAEASDFETYFDDVNYDEMDFGSSSWLNFPSATFTDHPGSSTPTSPTSQTFWAKSASGSGTKTVEWRLAAGSNMLVVMNTDGSAGIDVDVEFGINVGTWVRTLGIILIVVGIITFIPVFFILRRVFR